MLLIRTAGQWQDISSRTVLALVLLLVVRYESVVGTYLGETAVRLKTV